MKNARENNRSTNRTHPKIQKIAIAKKPENPELWRGVVDSVRSVV
jgi:hypothetical protein